MWYDELGIERVQHRFKTDPHGFSHALPWFERKWRRLQHLVTAGFDETNFF
jgi:hypothetical protein